MGFNENCKLTIIPYGRNEFLIRIVNLGDFFDGINHSVCINI